MGSQLSFSDSRIQLETFVGEICGFKPDEDLTSEFQKLCFFVIKGKVAEVLMAIKTGHQLDSSHINKYRTQLDAAIGDVDHVTATEYVDHVTAIIDKIIAELDS